MDDCLIVGAGVVGLSLAYELSGHGRRVHVIDRQAAGREASWAGAGILPAAGPSGPSNAHSQLASLSHAMHAAWADELRELTGLDNGYRRCGAIYVAHDAAGETALRQLVEHWRSASVAAEALSADDARKYEPSLASSRLAVRVRDECQIRNPRHLEALLAACQRRGVRVSEGVEAADFVVRGARIDAVRTNTGLLTAERYCVTNGCWAAALVELLRLTVAIRPVRGQMVLLRGNPTALRHIINDGPRYLVPRGDGRILVGSTEDDAGYDRRTTAQGVRGLLDLATRLVPSLTSFEIERTWAGLRPATTDGLPYLGPLPGLDNAFIAAGHFRSGLHLSPGTARIVGQAIRGVAPEIDLAPFRVDRG